MGDILLLRSDRPMAQGPILLLILLAAIAFIVLLTAKVKLHPFVVLLLAAYGVGLAAGLPLDKTIKAIVDGFGGTLGSIGIVIAAGTIIGFILEKSGGALVMADTVLRVVGQKRSVLAMGITGLVVSIPVFCDSGFVILSPLNRSLARRSGQSLAAYAIALSMGLYSSHVFVPPTPGPIAAAGTLGADLGSVILLGLVVSIPTMLAGYFFAMSVASKVKIDPGAEGTTYEEAKKKFGSLPSPVAAFAPIIVPVILIALKSVADYPTHPFGEGALAAGLSFIGNPNTALLIGIFLALLAVKGRKGEEVLQNWMAKGLESAGTIILITGAGGALGSILRATPIADYIGKSLSTLNIGIFLPFILAAALKTAQGSSTVSMITTSSIIAPMLASLGLAEGLGPALTALAIGAGAMTVSHANDSYFWVVAQFSDMTVPQAYRLQTVGTLITGVVGIATVFVLSLILL